MPRASTTVVDIAKWNRLTLRRDHWVPRSHRVVCYVCSKPFSWFRFKHNCVMCGEVVCKTCLDKVHVEHIPSSPRRRSVHVSEGLTALVCIYCSLSEFNRSSAFHNDMRASLKGRYTTVSSPGVGGRLVSSDQQFGDTIRFPHQAASPRLDPDGTYLQTHLVLGPRQEPSRPAPTTHKSPRHHQSTAPPNRTSIPSFYPAKPPPRDFTQDNSHDENRKFQRKPPSGRHSISTFPTSLPTVSTPTHQSNRQAPHSTTQTTPGPPISAQDLLNESHRLKALASYNILNTPREEAFDVLASSASSLLGCPISAVTFIDHDSQWFKAAVNWPISSIPRSMSFCATILRRAEPLIVLDTTLDPRFKKHRFVTQAPYVRFFACAPILSHSGHMLGSILVADMTPHEDCKVHILEQLAHETMLLLERRESKFVLKVEEHQRMEDLFQALLGREYQGIAPSEASNL
ncbi:hypothetical protein Ae201684P_007054 [Aphanomyces euteiches]|uniref:FYVE-type domain-containing protein n=1 Tax=Aphanomyces euteiches TaxID=100861 RepID=A0A6G0X8P3_9STRA|nr:hypothetical protein Ae201684_007444 [Aphanomyces euteiches]KAH9100862.1 hypothetical protein Ae201684P_007054 [Aphanomyces euteiches]KAH9155089.1 hypothetical protein AeRB84_002922 [Aphanomyces euteiches]